MGKRSPNKVDEQYIAGIMTRFEYYNRRKDVVVIPDEEGIQAADSYSVLRLWTVVANWAGRFVAANPTWTVNGSEPVEVLDEN